MSDSDDIVILPPEKQFSYRHSTEKQRREYDGTMLFLVKKGEDEAVVAVSKRSNDFAALVQAYLAANPGVSEQDVAVVGTLAARQDQLDRPPTLGEMERTKHYLCTGECGANRPKKIGDDVDFLSLGALGPVAALITGPEDARKIIRKTCAGMDVSAAEQVGQTLAALRNEIKNAYDAETQSLDLTRVHRAMEAAVDSLSASSRHALVASRLVAAQALITFDEGAPAQGRRIE